jgi:hypothetical protein
MLNSTDHCNRITPHSGFGFKPIIAGREAGVEPAGRYSRYVGVS